MNLINMIIINIKVPNLHYKYILCIHINVINQNFFPLNQLLFFLIKLIIIIIIIIIIIF
jgi:hypothetical protein